MQLRYMRKLRQRNVPKKRARVRPRRRAAVVGNGQLLPTEIPPISDANSSFQVEVVRKEINAGSVTKRKSRRKAKGKEREGPDPDLHRPPVGKEAQVQTRQRRIVFSG